MKIQKIAWGDHTNSGPKSQSERQQPHAVFHLQPLSRILKLVNSTFIMEPIGAKSGWDD
jgi:hypothetical protein